MITAIIPTKNRPDDIELALVSVLEQSIRPDELIVVDQGDSDHSKKLCLSLFESVSDVRLNYIHDTSISGLVDAKREAVKESKGDIICFLEDDIILEKDYFSQVLDGFEKRTDMLGCSGMIVNQPDYSAVYIFLHGLFFRGIFHDPRIKIFSHASTKYLIQCDILSGGLSCWKALVFETIKLDVDNGFFMMEDIEFSTRVARQFGHRLYVNKKARLVHQWSPVNRDLHGIRQQRKLRECIVFYKKRKNWKGASCGLFLVMIWWLTEATLQSISSLSFKPIIGYINGVNDGLSHDLKEVSRDE